ncbi:hypothetical protein RN001_003289 [Aquatica leii]|uniref:Sphingomyelin phosphodiesterase n=1 Tax=Aquatica leii TaxID=1421715 RepID=A0AAN7PIC9_9COLE|nr:hypothetical protein RN001_003289 [Aquatica leii]
MVSKCTNFVLFKLIFVWFQVRIWRYLLIAFIIACSFVKFLNCDQDFSDRVVDLKSLFVTKGVGGGSCFLCGFVIDTLLSAAKKNQPFAKIKSTIMSYCQMLKFENQVCSGIIDTHGPVILESLKLTSLKSREICSMLEEGVCPNVEVPSHEWAVTLPKVRKPILQNTPILQANRPKLKVLQINDIHLDLEYSEGSNANCNEPLCCRMILNTSSSIFFPAGRWGAYTCDLPIQMVEKTLQHIATQHPDIDYIMWVGDIVPHDIWQQSESGILETITKSVEQMKRMFPHTTIVPTIGNHELIPSGTFAPPWVKNKNFQMSWLLPKLYSLWQDWIPISEKARFIENGFYSILIRPNFKVISLNANYCYNQNWWLYVNSTDPGEQLAWLVQQLQEAESNGVKVHIIYYKIISRYEDTVTAQFFAHTHMDEFEVFYDNENYVTPVSVGYIAPSLTPYIGYNPAYRIYYIDAGENSTEMQENLEWVRCYSAKETYNLTSLRPTEWNNLIKRMEADESLFQTFYKHYHRHSPAVRKSTPQDKQDILCNLKSGKSHSKKIFCNSDKR